jgi:GNAT superfamily N-acetyltransferase
MNIRQATLSDAPVIAEFNLRLAAETEQLRLDPAIVRAGVAAVLADSVKGIYFVAEVEGAVVGQLMITYEWSDWRNGNLWWIQSVYVEPEFRGQGVFHALFKHLENLARASQEVAGLRLYMHTENHRARRTYERLGMKHSDYEVFEMDFALTHK